ncbi:MAG TPA: chemotaxis protein, partial [Pseudomonas sp.]|nr:chemotaxis protein [Pseudomonas sp.]
VVADEVRTLASRTQQSTVEIQQVIEQLQAGARDSAAVMLQGRAQVEVSVRQAQQA